MKLYIEQQISGDGEDSWVWALESDTGKKLANGIQVHATKDGCLKELKAVQKTFEITKIFERKPAKTIQTEYYTPVIENESLPDIEDKSLIEKGENYSLESEYKVSDRWERE